MDLFGRKRIAELEATNTNLNRRLEQWEIDWKAQQDAESKAHNQVEYLVRTIRQIDDQIFAMSQKTDWLSMRPHFQTLSDGMTARKVTESNRIADILRPQLIETYNEQNNATIPSKRLPRS
jgi:hypothetical protein